MHGQKQFTKLYSMVWYGTYMQLLQKSLMHYVPKYLENSQVFTPCLKET